MSMQLVAALTGLLSRCSGRAPAWADMHSLRLSLQKGAVLASQGVLLLAWGEQLSCQAVPLLLAIWVNGPAPFMHE